MSASHEISSSEWYYLPSQIWEALERNKKVLGTIMKAPHSFADEVKGRKDTLIIEVTKGTWNEVLAKIIGQLNL